MPANRPRTTKAAVTTTIAGGGFIAASLLIKQSSLPPSSLLPYSSPPSSPPPPPPAGVISLSFAGPCVSRRLPLCVKSRCENTADAAAHPTDGLKAVDFRNALEDYELKFEHFVPNDKIDDYMQRRGRVLLKLDSLFQAAVKVCPFVNASPLDLYCAASQQFHVDFGVPYKPTDHHHRQQKEAMITKNLEILDVQYIPIT
ncbi:hypothetical protein K438DRAFT_1965551 [Mycena galopus ATCC 62051]|nr:hypothetical protein K438DRAFT_1965551 [Mycena galopus ATCC 62051]